MSVLLAALALGALSLAVHLLMAPIAVSLRAPDAGDLFLLRVRHPAFALDLWLTPERALEMAAAGALEYVTASPPGRVTLGKMPLPGILGHVAGVPFDSTTAAWLRDRGLAIHAWNARHPRKEPGKKGKPADQRRTTSDWLRILSEVRPRLLEALRVERLEIDLEYGTGDPSTTGFVAAGIWQACALLPPPCRIHAQAYWAEPRFHVEGDGKVLFFPWRVGRAILSLWLAMRRKAAREEPTAAIQETRHVPAER